MNATNRAANRLLLVIVGLLLVAAGAAAIALAVLPALAATWRAWFVPARFAAWVTEPAVGAVSWAAIAVAAVAAVLALLLVVFVVRHGGGRTSAVLDRPTSPAGRTRIDLAVPRTLLAEALEDQRDVLASSVTAYSVRGVPTLKIAVRARRGASPTTVAEGVVEALHALDAVLGEQVPALIQVSGGFRSRSSGRARVA